MSIGVDPTIHQWKALTAVNLTHISSPHHSIEPQENWDEAQPGKGKVIMYTIANTPGLLQHGHFALSWLPYHSTVLEVSIWYCVLFILLLCFLILYCVLSPTWLGMIFLERSQAKLLWMPYGWEDVHFFCSSHPHYCHFPCLKSLCCNLPTHNGVLFQAFLKVGNARRLKHDIAYYINQLLQSISSQLSFLKGHF